MKKICIHWSAGPYRKTSLDTLHYHFTVDKDGVVTNGEFPVEANIPPLKPSQYAAHCGGGNSYCIGVSLLGMGGYKGRNSVGQFPLTRKQCEAAWQFIAGLCKGYGIPVTPETVFTHYEFGKRNPSTSSRGKIDITFLPHEPKLQAHEVGDHIRGKVRWYLGEMKKEKTNASNDKP